MVEVVGWDAFHATTGHCHGWIGFEACHTQESDQGTGNIFTDTTTVRVVHLQVMQRVAFAFAHRDTGVTDIVGNPVGEDGDLFHLRLFAPDQFVYFLLGFGNGTETAVVFVHFVKPKGFVLPAWCAGHHQFRCGVEQVDHIRFASGWHDVCADERISFPTVLVTHGRGAFSLIELELHFFLHRDVYLIYLADSWLGCPEGDDIIELSTHGRDETGFVVACTASQQGIGETFFVDLIIDDIARIETAYFHHDLPCSPIDGAGRSGIIQLLGDVEVDYVAIGFVDGDTMKLCMCRQRIVIVFEDAIGDGPARVHNFDDFADRERTGAGRLHGHSGAVE